MCLRSGGFAAPERPWNDLGSTYRQMRNNRYFKGSLFAQVGCEGGVIRRKRAAVTAGKRLSDRSGDALARQGTKPGENLAQTCTPVGA